MMTHGDLPYEALRAWGMQADLVRPPGLAQLLRFGLAAWITVIRQTLTLPTTAVSPAQEVARCAAPTALVPIVATMLREVQR
jgi:hypothetical protein